MKKNEILISLLSSMPLLPSTVPVVEIESILIVDTNFPAPAPALEAEISTKTSVQDTTLPTEAWINGQPKWMNQVETQATT